MSAYVGNSGGVATFFARPSIEGDPPHRRGDLLYVQFQPGGVHPVDETDGVFVLVLDDLPRTLPLTFSGSTFYFTATLPYDLADGTYNGVVEQTYAPSGETGWSRLAAPLTVFGDRPHPSGPALIGHVSTPLPGEAAQVTGTNLFTEAEPDGTISCTIYPDYPDTTSQISRSWTQVDHEHGSFVVPSWMTPGVYTVGVYNFTDVEHYFEFRVVAGITGGGSGGSGGGGGTHTSDAPTPYPSLAYPADGSPPLLTSPLPFPPMPSYAPTPHVAGLAYVSIGNQPGDREIVTDAPLYADGINLNQLGFAVQSWESRFRTPAKVGSNIAQSDVDGTIWVKKRHGEGSFSLRIGVREMEDRFFNLDGEETEGARERMLAKISLLAELFSRDLITFHQWIPLSRYNRRGRWVTCRAEVTESIELAVEGALESGIFEINPSIPASYWEDVPVGSIAAPPSYTLDTTPQITSGTHLGGSTNTFFVGAGYLAEATARVSDLTLRIHGPAHNPSVECAGTGFTYVGDPIPSGLYLEIRLGSKEMQFFHTDGTPADRLGYATDIRATDPNWLTYFPRAPYFTVQDFVDLTAPPGHSPGPTVDVLGPRKYVLL